MSQRSAPAGEDAATLAAWWRAVLATGDLPAEAAPVRTRLVRQVGRADLASGPVFVKVMSFPRAGDRLRYLLRPLPAAHEAAMLRRVAAAGIACPEVLDVRTARRAGLPHRSMLVLRALPVVAEPAAAPVSRLGERAELAQRLAVAGLLHPDLNPDNFVRLADGRLAVLDLQSMRPTRRRRRAARAMAARLLLEAHDVEPEAALAVLVDRGLVAAGDRGAVAAAARIALAYLRKRVRRCWQTSTEFVRRRNGLLGVEHRRRGELPPGRWIAGGRDLLRCWQGQRALEVLDGRPPILFAIRRNWPWLPGAPAVYIAATVVEERVRDELRALMAGHARFVATLGGAAKPSLVALQALRQRTSGEVQR